jgi:hypothetical protein
MNDGNIYSNTGKDAVAFVKFIAVPLNSAGSRKGTESSKI